MPAQYRYRYKGKFVSQERAEHISRLKNASKFVSKEPITHTRYRYRGRFVSEPEFKRLERRAGTRPYVSADIPHPPTTRIKRGVDIIDTPIAIMVREALAKDREKAEAKRALAREAAERERKKKEEESKVVDFASRAAERAIAEDITIGEALDDEGFDEEDFDYYSFDEVFDIAGEIIDEGEPFYDFELMDLEEDFEDKYKGGK